MAALSRPGLCTTARQSAGSNRDMQRGRVSTASRRVGAATQRLSAGVADFCASSTGRCQSQAAAQGAPLHSRGVAPHERMGCVCGCFVSRGRHATVCLLPCPLRQPVPSSWSTQQALHRAASSGLAFWQGHARGKGVVQERQRRGMGASSMQEQERKEVSSAGARFQEGKGCLLHTAWAAREVSWVERQNLATSRIRFWLHQLCCACCGMPLCQNEVLNQSCSFTRSPAFDPAWLRLRTALPLCACHTAGMQVVVAVGTLLQQLPPLRAPSQAYEVPLAAAAPLLMSPAMLQPARPPWPTLPAARRLVARQRLPLLRCLPPQQRRCRLRRRRRFVRAAASGRAPAAWIVGPAALPAVVPRRRSLLAPAGRVRRGGWAW